MTRGAVLAREIITLTQRRDDEVRMAIGDQYVGETTKSDRAARIADIRTGWSAEVLSACVEAFGPEFEPGWFLEGD